MTQHQDQIKTVRCAIYTRSPEPKALESQRRAAEAYIATRKRDGWVALSERYDDACNCGTDTERQALQRLLTDVANGRVDCLVVQSVARLSRSVPDLTQIMKTLNQHTTSVDFVDGGSRFAQKNGGGQ